MGTFIVGIIVLAIAISAAASIYRDKKAGRCSGGGSGGSGCCNGCPEGQDKNFMKY